jgi:hypothetical protein
MVDDQAKAPSIFAAPFGMKVSTAALRLAGQGQQLAHGLRQAGEQRRGRFA